MIDHLFDELYYFFQNVLNDFCRLKLKLNLVDILNPQLFCAIEFRCLINQIFKMKNLFVVDMCLSTYLIKCSVSNYCKKKNKFISIYRLHAD